jgi:large subunit ribosomal protein L1
MDCQHYYQANDAVDHIKKNPSAKFDETIDVTVNTSLDPRKPGQTLRSVAQLPHGIGKAARIAVFARDDKAKEALDAGELIN